MPMNTIQISVKRISTSDHSAGCSKTKRVRIWHMPRHAAATSMAQASDSGERRACARSSAQEQSRIGGRAATARRLT